jgi:hypothetical protein
LDPNDSSASPEIFPELYNITTLDNCITACAQYNYQLPFYAGYDGSSGGGSIAEAKICDGVVWGYTDTTTLWTDHPTRCYLKNGVTTNTVQDSTNAHAAILDR